MESLLVGSSLGAVVLGVAATLLALAVLVQVLQELWKFLLSTQAGVYTRVLEDFLGPWGRQMSQPGVLPEFQARGPFQFRKLGPTGKLLPLSRPDLVEGLERTAGAWPRRALRALRLEVALQEDGKPGTPSSEWRHFLEELHATEPGGPDGQDREDLLAFLKDEGAAQDLPRGDMSRLLMVFRERFFSHVLDAERHFGRLQELFDFRYRRRNLLITFLLGFVVAFVLSQPIQQIVDRANAMSPQEAIALADNVLGLYESAQDTTAAARSREQLESSVRQLVDAVNTSVAGGGARVRLNGIDEFDDANFAGKLWYLAGCLLTAILLSFGAPFWNDLVGALAGRSRALWRGNKPSQAPEEPVNA